MTLTLHTASCSVHVPAALREHQRPIVDALLDATFAGTLSEAHVGQARSDGSLVVWSAPPEAVADVVTSDDVRALCHTVQVVAAELATVDVVANIRLQPTASASLIAEIESGLLAAFEQARGLGWDVTTSWLVARLQVPGVHSVDLVQPAANVVVAPNQCAALGAVTLNSNTAFRSGCSKTGNILLESGTSNWV